MNVLFCAPYVPSRVRPRPFNFIRILAEHGHQVTLLAVQNGDPPSHEVHRYCQKVLLFDNPSVAAIARCVVALPGPTALQAAYCEAPGLARAFDQLIATDDYGVVHIEHLRAAKLGLGLRSVPVVFDCVDALSVLWQKYRHSRSFTRRALAAIEASRVERYERQLLHEFARCLVSSDRDRAELLRLAPGAQVTTVPNACDVSELAKVNRRPRPSRILFIGRMSYEPNVVAVEQFALNVLPGLAVAHPSLEFRIVGATPNRRVRRLAADRRVSVTGFLPDLSSELAEATISLCNVPVAGGTQNKVLESVAAGVPVVTRRDSAEPLGLEDRRHVLIADNPQAIAEAVNELLDDSQLAKRIALSGQEHARRSFSLEATAGRLLGEYAHCRTQGPGRETSRLESGLEPERTIARAASHEAVQ